MTPRREWRRAAVAAVLVAASACAPGVARVAPACAAGDDRFFVLAAQAVPTATLLPCVNVLPAGWRFEGVLVESGEARMWLESDRAGIRAVEAILTRQCSTSDAVEVDPAPDEAGTRRFEEPISLTPAYVADRYYVFEGGCITYRYRFVAGAAPTLALEADEALSFTPRSLYVDRVREEFGLTLCGAGAPPCEG
jgi:hypothetical protein